MRDSVPRARYSSVCNVLRQWNISLIPTYRVYRLYDTEIQFTALTLHFLAASYEKRVEDVQLELTNLIESFSQLTQLTMTNRYSGPLFQMPLGSESVPNRGVPSFQGSKCSEAYVWGNISCPD